jgi:glycosyltransferase involved in cell wall biosynthesis
MERVRLYGRVLGHGSHARVTHGFSAALRAHRVAVALKPLDVEPDPDDAPIPGALAHHGVYTGPLGGLPQLQRNARHERRWAMVAPNSDRVPDRLLGLLGAHCTDIMVPSHWALEVMAQEVDRALERQHMKRAPRLRVVPHGLDEGFRCQHPLLFEARERYREGAFEVLHFSTTEFQRKGTALLLEAWRSAMSRGALPDRARLTLVLDVPAAGRTVEWMADHGYDCSSVFVSSRGDYAPATLARHLGQYVHVVCQPSRGEGFGLVPLEARACGVPVVMTACTGHSEHVREGAAGVVVVPHGPSAGIDDVPGARAPEVAAQDIEAALVEAYTSWSSLSNAAEVAAQRVGEEWSWKRKLQPWIQALES